MAIFQSNRVLVNATDSEVFAFLSDFRNFKNLMPSQIANWQADEQSCSFSIQGMADFSMRMVSKTPNASIHIVADGKNPVDYSLDCLITPEDDQNCMAEIVFNADLNPFQKMVASGPLQNLVNMLADKLSEIFAAGSKQKPDLF